MEYALIEHPAVRESAAVGIPDAEIGEVVKAFVALARGYPGRAELAAALQAFVRVLIAAYKYPRAVELVADLPKTVSGKIQRGIMCAREGNP